jgi:hypothetical protein
MRILIFHNFFLCVAGKFNASAPVLNLWTFFMSQVSDLTQKEEGKLQTEKLHM